MSAFAIYLTGFLILIVGLSYAAHLGGMPLTWIAAGAIVLLGVGIVTAVSRPRPRDPPR